MSSPYTQQESTTSDIIIETQDNYTDDLVHPRTDTYFFPWLAKVTPVLLLENKGSVARDHLGKKQMQINVADGWMGDGG